MLRRFHNIRKSDRRILLSVLAVIVVALTVIVFGGSGDATTGGSSTSTAPNAMSPLPLTAEAAHGESLQNDTAAAVNSGTAELFAFDPNTADSTALRRLGLAEWQVRNIYKYRAAGGVYQRKEDFARLYGLTVKKYRELEPYIHISADYLPAATLFPRSRQQDASRGDTTFTPRYPVKLGDGETIDLATADTTLLQRVPGIGSYYAHRIVNYRRELGGFVSIAQLDEIEDFPQKAKDFLTLDAVAVVQLNVNTLSLNELKRHPYINFYQARAIVDYRRQHGTISDISELRFLQEFPQEALERLRPYVSY